MTDTEERLRSLASSEVPAPTPVEGLRARAARRRTRRLVAAGAAALVLVAGIGVVWAGGPDERQVDTVDRPPTSETVTSTAPTTEAPTTSTTSTTTVTTTTTEPQDPAPSGGLPGTRVEMPPAQGAMLGVVGVAAGDVLNVRATPDPGAPVVATLEPTQVGIEATGHNRQLGDGNVWAELRVGDRTGWANTRYLLQPGMVTDETAALYPTPDQRPVAGSVTELAMIVVADLAGNGEPTTTVVDGPSGGDPAEVVVDVIGLRDDAVGGYRLHVFATPTGGGYVLRTVESTALCSRSVDASGFCV